MAPRLSRLQRLRRPEALCTAIRHLPVKANLLVSSSCLGVPARAGAAVLLRCPAKRYGQCYFYLPAAKRCVSSQSVYPFGFSKANLSAGRILSHFSRYSYPDAFWLAIKFSAGHI
ncbi:hypothetical protein KCP73_14080 [Salmonella enterica subsp. enterica]|nr:hypothetical protein KCP73_14080 [Salmonella enterica subsp. enterica]